MSKQAFKSGEFKEAVAYFKDKIALPTKTWKDLQGEMHAKAFTVAGAMREDILCDFQKAVGKAITDGMSIQEFRKEFDSIVKRTGWQHNGSRNWRSDLIYQTNLHTAYAAGREKQMQDSKMRKIYPYARYRSMDDGRERPEHKAWNNIVLPWDDPWWDKHTPPNGWGCRCWKEPVSALEVKALGLKVRSTAPTPPNDTKGIDKGWDYNVGNAAYGKTGIPHKGWKLSDQAGLWESSPPELDKDIPILPAPKRTRYTEDQSEFEANFAKALKQRFENSPDARFDGDAMIYIKRIGGFSYPFQISPKVISRHILNKDRKSEWEPIRTEYINFFLDTLENPGDMRIEFTRSNTQQVAIMPTFMSVFKEGNSEKVIQLVFKTDQGCLLSWTAYPKDKPKEKVARKGVRVK